MANITYNPFSITKESLTTPTSTQQYPLGFVYISSDDSSSAAVKRFLYIKANGALTAKQPYRIVTSGTAAAEWTTASFISLTGAVTLIGIPQVAFTSGYYGFVQIGGAASYLPTAATIAAGATLKVMTSGSTLVLDSSTGVVSNSTVGSNVSALTSDSTSGTVILNGVRVVVSS